MKIQLEYVRKGETVQVSTNLMVIVAWERKFKRKADTMHQGMGIEDLAYLAFEASKLAKVVVPAAFDDFIAQLDSIKVVAEEQENPTPAAPTDDH